MALCLEPTISRLPASAHETVSTQASALWSNLHPALPDEKVSLPPVTPGRAYQNV